MNNPFKYTPDEDCAEAFLRLQGRLDAMKVSDNPEEKEFIQEIEEGKMLGVLIASDKEGVRHTLYAFSGQAGERGFHQDGFVDPVFDYLQPDGYFKTREAEISRRNLEIARFERDVLAKVRNEYEQIKAECEAEISICKKKYSVSKLDRKRKRESGTANENDLSAMIRESQFEKAELRRLKKRLASITEYYEKRLREAESEFAELKRNRRTDSERLQEWLFNNFRLLNALGESRSLSEIFAETGMGVPPSGAGECCAPKLLHAAYLRGWTPESMAEYWYGKPKGGEVRIHGTHYAACRGKCLPILKWMLQGLDTFPPLESDNEVAAELIPEITYENEWFCIVNKPSGMLSVPGKGKAVSVQEWLEEKYGKERGVKPAHRLDQDTSGLLIATFGSSPFKEIQSLFARRLVKKTYVAELEGDYTSCGLPRKGCVNLPLSPDWLDRPRQRIDFANGKESVTDYEFTGVSNGKSRVVFHPRTGRTHQLRVHSASGLGLGMPIAGDRIYGRNTGTGGGRLHLHAHKIEFTFPVDGEYYFLNRRSHSESGMLSRKMQIWGAK